MSNAYVSDFALLLLEPERIRQAEVGVANHPKYRPDAPIGHRFCHQVGHRLLVRGLDFDSDVDAVFPLFYRKGRHPTVVKRRWGSTRQRIKIPAVPRATQEPFLNGTFSERATLVGAFVVQRGKLALVMGRAYGREPAGHRFHPDLQAALLCGRLCTKLALSSGRPQEETPA